LLVGIRPVEDLFFDELSGREGLEGSPGEVEVSLSGYREELGLGFAELVELLVKAALRTCGGGWWDTPGRGDAVR